MIWSIGAIVTVLLRGIERGEVTLNAPSLGQGQAGDDFQAFGLTGPGGLQVATVARKVKDDLIVDFLIEPDQLEIKIAYGTNQGEFPAFRLFLQKRRAASRRIGKGAVVVGDLVKTRCTESGADRGTQCPSLGHTVQIVAPADAPAVELTKIVVVIVTPAKGHNAKAKALLGL